MLNEILMILSANLEKVELTKEEVKTLYNYIMSLSELIDKQSEVIKELTL